MRLTFDIPTITQMAEYSPLSPEIVVNREDFWDFILGKFTSLVLASTSPLRSRLELLLKKVILFMGFLKGTHFHLVCDWFCYGDHCYTFYTSYFSDFTR